jgi:hypothetical protein
MCLEPLTSLQDEQRRDNGLITGENKQFTSLQSAQRGFEPQPASLGVKWAGREPDTYLAYCRGWE